MTALHLGVPLDLVVVNLAKGEQHAPEFLALNPNHRVPVLEDDGFVLWESYAIQQYLADRTPGQTLYPVDAKARADVSRWMYWCSQSLMPGAGTLNWERVYKGMSGQGPADPIEEARAESSLRIAGQILDRHLASRNWMCGEALSLADYAIAAPLADQHRSRYPLDDFANLQRWFRQMQKLPAWAKTEP
jgi:glutathione S-transferase